MIGVFENDRGSDGNSDANWRCGSLWGWANHRNAKALPFVRRDLIRGKLDLAAPTTFWGPGLDGDVDAYSCAETRPSIYISLQFAENVMGGKSHEGRFDPLTYLHTQVMRQEEFWEEAA
jgi:hypothetical protein